MPGKWTTTCGCVFLYVKHPACTLNHFTQISAPPGDGCSAPTTPREE